MKKTVLAILILLLIGIIIICNYNNQDDTHAEIVLTPINSIELSVPEPSGLHFDKTTKTLWTVSDENSTIYNIDLNGNILNKIIVNGLDLEGVTKINDSTLATILERDRIVVFLDEDGMELKRFDINVKGDRNKGLEGISYNINSSNLYLLNEKEPGKLLIIDTSGNLIAQNTLTFAKDYSGLFIVESKKELWIISDEDEAIFKCALDGTVLKKYKINIEQIEGITIDEENGLLYLVSDPLEKLIVYKLP